VNTTLAGLMKMLVETNSYSGVTEAGLFPVKLGPR
jgi:hypothetical protein